jgi:hypothetical protein
MIASYVCTLKGFSCEIYTPAVGQSGAVRMEDVMEEGRCRDDETKRIIERILKFER